MWVGGYKIKLVGKWEGIGGLVAGLCIFKVVG